MGEGWVLSVYVLCVTVGFQLLVSIAFAADTWQPAQVQGACYVHARKHHQLLCSVLICIRSDNVKRVSVCLCLWPVLVF